MPTDTKKLFKSEKIKNLFDSFKNERTSQDKDAAINSAESKMHEMVKAEAKPFLTNKAAQERITELEAGAITLGFELARKEEELAKLKASRKPASSPRSQTKPKASPPKRGNVTAAEYAPILTMTRDEFLKMSPRGRSDFSIAGGKITN